MDEEQLEFCYSLVVRKFNLGKDDGLKDLFIYKPVEIVFGIMGENDTFINDNGREYKNIVDISFIDKSDEDEGYFLCMTESEAEKEFGSDDPEEVYGYYEELLYNKVFIAVEGESNSCYITVVDKEVLKNIDAHTIGFSGDDAIIPMKDIEDLLEMDDLEFIKDYLIHITSVRDEIDRQIDEALNDDRNQTLTDDENKEDALTEEEKKQLEEDILRDAKENGYEDIYSPEYKRKRIKNLYKRLHEIVIGQDEAIDTVCYTIYKNTKLKDGEKKTNCLLVGPTGSGKSLILEILGKEYDMPVVHVDSNSLSTTGYVGDNVEDCLAQLMIKADGNQKKAEHGIVVFDEVDKKGTSDNGDVGGKGVINQLLRFVEGQDYNVDYILNNKKRHCIFNTTNLTVFACGAFPEIYEQLLKKNTPGKGIGFMSPVKNEDEQKEDRKKQLEKLNISQEDIGTIGRMGPEFAGRFIVAPLHKLTKDDLVNIMNNSKESPLTRESQLLEEDDIKFYNDDKFVEKIAEDAYNSGTGGRGVRSTIESIFKIINKKVIFEDAVERADDGNIYLYGTVDEDGNLCIIGSKGNINLLNNKEVELEQTQPLYPIDEYSYSEEPISPALLNITKFERDGIERIGDREPLNIGTPNAGYTGNKIKYSQDLKEQSTNELDYKPRKVKVLKKERTS